MKNRELLLFFFVIYNLISTIVYLRFYYKYMEEKEKRESYIIDLENELAKRHKK